jgi:shikimate kinase
MTSPPEPRQKDVSVAGGGRSGVQAVFLVGFMGAGKSAVGQALSQRLGWRFEDLDQRIEASQGRSIAEIFRQFGETGFRRLEHAALRSLLTDLRTTPTVAALGGGAWVQPANRALLAASAVPAVFLDAPVTELWQRCLPEREQRPLLRDEKEFRQLYEARRPRYLEASLRVETQGKAVGVIAAEVASGLHLGV